MSGERQLRINGQAAELSGMEHTLRPSRYGNTPDNPRLGKGELYVDRGVGAGSHVVFTAEVYRDAGVAVLNTDNQGKYNIIYKIINQGHETWYYSEGRPCDVALQDAAYGHIKAQSIKVKPH